jgi:hypothetical protein
MCPPPHTHLHAHLRTLAFALPRAAAMEVQGLNPHQAAANFWVIDAHGLVTDARSVCGAARRGVPCPLHSPPAVPVMHRLADAGPAERSQLRHAAFVAAALVCSGWIASMQHPAALLPSRRMLFDITF